MAQYIDKSAVKAIIGRMQDCTMDEDGNFYSSSALAEYNILCDIENRLDTLEVKEVDLEDAVDDAKDLAMRDMAWKVHVMISEGKSISEIDHYVCGICDF